MIGKECGQNSTFAEFWLHSFPAIKENKMHRIIADEKYRFIPEFSIDTNVNNGRLIKNKGGMFHTSLPIITQ